MRPASAFAHPAAPTAAGPTPAEPPMPVPVIEHYGQPARSILITLVGVLIAIAVLGSIAWRFTGGSLFTIATPSMCPDLCVGTLVFDRPAVGQMCIRDRGGTAQCITTDDSLVGDLVRAGELTESEARTHPQRSILTKALGVGPDVQPHLVRVDPASGDRLLLCTDGLFNELDEGEIGSVLSSVKDPNEAAVELVRLANSRGGSDNVSVVVVDIARPPEALPE